jgi:4-amino-4-deoxy-L-arabinose transferase-like glycosyltransferase
VKASGQDAYPAGGDPGRAAGRRDLLALALMALLFLAWHVPLMYRTAAGTDEDHTAIPGTTILRSGVPKIPYMPVRDPRTSYLDADVALYILPPLSFYLQALVQVVLGDGLGPARMASALEGLAATYVVYRLARLWLDEGHGALWAAMLFLFSRALHFPATTARPDMAAALFGLLAVWLLVRDRGAMRPGRLAASGACAGLSLLSHPAGVVPCLQLGIWVLARAGPGIRRRPISATVLTASALGAFSLWGPVIALHPQLFWDQFRGNVIDRAGPGLGDTLLDPRPVFLFQAREILELTNPIQAALYAMGLAWLVFRGLMAFRPSDPPPQPSPARGEGGGSEPPIKEEGAMEALPPCGGGERLAEHPIEKTLGAMEALPPCGGGLGGGSDSNNGHRGQDPVTFGPSRELLYYLASSILLLVLLMGQHSLRAYYAYPAAFASIAVGGLAADLSSAIGRRLPRPGWAPALMTALLVLVLLPGSGLRTLSAHLRHWDDPAYDVDAFTRRVMADVPSGALAVVDTPYVLNFYLAGHRVVDANCLEFMPVPYEYLVVSRLGLDRLPVRREDLIPLGRYGDPTDEFACFAELFAVRGRTAETRTP